MVTKQSGITHAVRFAVYAAVSLAVVGVGLAHAELAIWQVENNPPGTDSGNEWLTLINTGEYDTFDGYGIQTTHGRIASYAVPSMTLGMCEYHKITFPKQTVDNEDDTVKLLKDGLTIYETPTIKDTKNDDRFWTNPNVAAICGDTQAGTTTETVQAPGVDPNPPDTSTEMTWESRIQALEARADAADDATAELTEVVAAEAELVDAVTAELRWTLELLEAEIKVLYDTVSAIQYTIDFLLDIMN